MADITKLSRLIGAIQRNVTLSDNTLIVDNLKIKMGSGDDANHATFSGTLTIARTITMPDTDIDLSKIDANESDIADLRTTQGTVDSDTHLGTFTGTTIADSSTVKGALQSLETSVETKAVAGDVDDLITLSGVPVNSVDLGTFTGTTIADSSTIKVAIQSLETYAESTRSLVQNFEWKDSALDYVVDNTAAPATETSGDRYILSHDGGSPHANYDGASAGDIVEFDGAVWVATTPTTGTFIAVDDDSTGIYQWGGASWSFKEFEATTASTGLTKVGVDIQLADAAENASGIKILDGAITLEDLGAFDSLSLDHTQDDTNDWTVADGSTIAAHLDELADRTSTLESSSSSSVLAESLITDVNLSTQLYALRWGRTADLETGGRVYLAEKTPDTNDGTDDLFHVIGLYLSTGNLPGDPITVTKAGPMTATAHGFTVGDPIYLSGQFGNLSSTAPTAAGEAVVKVGMARDANTIDVQIQIMGVN